MQPLKNLTCKKCSSLSYTCISRYDQAPFQRHFNMRVLLLAAVIALSTLSTVSSSYSKEWINSKAGWETQDNVAYPGGDLEGWTKVTRTDAEECRKLCKENKANFFTFRKTSKTCWCKKTKGEIERGGPIPDNDAISGTILCQDRKLNYARLLAYKIYVITFFLLHSSI